MRSGIQISQASVRRILEEPSPSPSSKERQLQNPRSKNTQGHLLHPISAHHVWHMDMTTVRVLWMRYEIAAIIDGFSRKIIGLQAYCGTPPTADLLEFIDQSICENTAPRFIIMDRGGQFQMAFFVGMIQRKIKQARSPARVWQFNAKVDRLFWSLKRWWRVSLFPPNLNAIQKRLDANANWHNLYRPHASFGMLTPSEAECGTHHPDLIRYTEGGELEPKITIRRQHVGDDPRLLYPVIKMRPKNRFVA